MPRARTPLAKAVATGQANKHPERFKDRKQPKVAKIGEASDWLVGSQVTAWESFKKEMPWLAESDRAHLEIACTIRARLFDKEEVGIQALNALRSAIAQMGGNPSDRQKVIVEDDSESEDATEAYFN